MSVKFESFLRYWSMPIRGRAEGEEHERGVIATATGATGEERQRIETFLLEQLGQRHCMAATALGAMQSPAAAEPLSAIVKEGALGALHVEAARALVAIGGGGQAEAQQLLIDIAARGDWYTARIAAQALGGLRGEAVRQALTEALRHEEDLVRINAAESLLRVVGLRDRDRDDRFDRILKWLASSYTAVRRHGLGMLDEALRRKQSGEPLGELQGRMVTAERSAAGDQIWDLLTGIADSRIEKDALAKLDRAEWLWAEWALISQLEERQSPAIVEALVALGSQLALEVFAEIRPRATGVLALALEQALAHD